MWLFFIGIHPVDADDPTLVKLDGKEMLASRRFKGIEPGAAGDGHIVGFAGDHAVDGDVPDILNFFGCHFDLRGAFFTVAGISFDLC